MQVKSLMHPEVRCCRPGDPLARAAQLMWEADVGCVPVVDGEGRLVGIVTDRDLAMAAWLTGRPLSEIQVGTVMARRVHVCHPDDPVHTAETVLRMHQIRRLPVVDEGGRPIGMLSINDLCRELAGQHLNTSRQMDCDHLVQTLAAIGAPRKAAPAARSPAGREQPARI